MFYYAKIYGNTDSQQVYDLFVSHGANFDSIIIDSSLSPKKTDGVLNKLKMLLLESQESLIIDSLNSLGKTKREISKELQWFVNNNVRLIILDLPSTFSDKCLPIQLLSELYMQLAAVEIRNVKQNQAIGIQNGRSQNKPLGRRRIPYPENWEVTYKRWVQKEINITEFMQLTNLKKGTLYNLIKQYREHENAVRCQQNIV